MTAAKPCAGYASTEKHAALQSRIAAIDSVVDVKIREVMSEEGSKASLNVTDKEILNIMGPLLSTTEGLIIRPVASVSAFVCLSTAHKLAMMLDIIEVPKDFEATRSEWSRRVKALGKDNAKWGKLRSSVPESLVKLVWTQLDLAIRAIPDPKVR